MPFKSNAQRRLFYSKYPELAKEWEKHTPNGRRLPEKVKKASSKKEVHRAADKAGIPWDGDPKFKKWSKHLTGKSCLDKMSPAQLSRMKRAIKSRGMKKEAGHVGLRAKERSTIPKADLTKLRIALKKWRLRKGETYHYTWPGKGHAIIGDVGKNKPHHVIKTIYKPSDNPPGRRLAKLANLVNPAKVAIEPVDKKPVLVPRRKLNADAPRVNAQVANASTVRPTLAKKLNIPAIAPPGTFTNRLAPAANLAGVAKGGGFMDKAKDLFSANPIKDVKFNRGNMNVDLKHNFSKDLHAGLNLTVPTGKGGGSGFMASLGGTF